MPYEFMMAGNELAGPAPKRRPAAAPRVVKVRANTAQATALTARAVGTSPVDALTAAFAPRPPAPAPAPMPVHTRIYDTIRLPVRGSHRIAVRGGIPMQGPVAVKLTDAKPTLSLSRPLGTKVALAGLGLGALDPRLGKQIRTAQSTSLKGRPVALLPVSTGSMIPGLSGGGFMPGLGGGGFMPGLGGGGFMPGLGASLDRRIPGPKTRTLTARGSTKMQAAAGKMLPGLACDDPEHTVSVGYLGAPDLYDQMDGVGMDAWSGMPTPGMSAPGMGAVTLPVIGELTAPKLIAAAALMAFFMMARKRYA